MATYYIDPDTGTGTGDGSLGDPYKSWTEVTISNNNTYLQKRGTTDAIVSDNDSLTESNKIYDANGTITIGAYGTGSRPIISNYVRLTDTSNWSRPDAGSYPNVWRYDGFTDTGATNSRRVLGIGTLEDTSPMLVASDFATTGTTISNWSSAPAAYGEYDCSVGGGLAPSLYMWSDGGVNPVENYGTIYLVMYDYALFNFIRCADVRISDINFKYYYGIRILNNSGSNSGVTTVTDCSFDYCKRGVDYYMAGDFQDIGTEISGNTFNVIHDSAVTVSGASSGLWKFARAKIHHNYINTVNTDIATGGIYIGETRNMDASLANRIYKNTVINSNFSSLLFPFDGYGLMADGASGYNYFYGNRLISCERGLKDNSGDTGNIWAGNYVSDSEIGMRVTDSENIGNQSITIANNTFVDCGYGATKHILDIDDDGVSASTTIIKNNIFYGKSAADTQAVYVSATVVTNGTVTESNNCYYNNNVNNTVALTDEITTDPQLDANGYPASTSPCIGAGVKWWTGANPVGADGEPFADMETDIGAIQSKHSILHPTKL
jgi:hypothetical protein